VRRKNSYRWGEKRIMDGENNNCPKVEEKKNNGWKRVKDLLKVLVSLVIIYVLIRNIGLEKIWLALKSTNLWILLLVLPIKLFSLLLNGVNITLFLRAIDKKIRFWRIVVWSNLAWSIGLFFPGRVGEFSIIYFLKSEGVEFGESTAVALLDKMTTFFVLSVLSIIGVFYYFNFTSALWLAGILLIMMIGSVTIVLNARLRGLVKEYLLRKYARLFKGFNDSFRRILGNRKMMLGNTLVTAVKWFFSFSSFSVIFLSLGAAVKVTDVMMISSLATIISLIPISMGGIGLREYTAVYLFNGLGISPEITFVAYLLNTFINYIFASGIILANVHKINLEEIKRIRSKQSEWNNTEEHLG